MDALNIFSANRVGRNLGAWLRGRHASTGFSVSVQGVYLRKETTNRLGPSHSHNADPGITNRPKPTRK